jgi:hypothetical protein
MSVQVFTDKDRQYLSTFDPDGSNWLRYVRPAPAREQRNLAPIVRHGELYFVTVTEIVEGEELLYWSDDTATSWSKKKMEKTSRSLELFDQLCQLFYSLTCHCHVWCPSLCFKSN